MKTATHITADSAPVKLIDYLPQRQRIRIWNREKQKEILLQRFRAIMKGRDLVITDKGYKKITKEA